MLCSIPFYFILFFFRIDTYIGTCKFKLYIFKLNEGTLVQNLKFLNIYIYKNQIKYTIHNSESDRNWN